MERSIVLVAVAFALAPSPRAEVLSKSFEFKPGVILEVAASAQGGLRLDSVLFDVPAASTEQLTRSRGMVTVQLAVSNGGELPARLGLAVALFDAGGRLVGVASGGSRLTPLRPGHQRTFRLVFDGVYAEAHRAATFQVTLEPR